MQIPIGLEGPHEGLVDIITREAVYFDGEKGLTIVRGPVPDELVQQCEEKRKELIERLEAELA